MTLRPGPDILIGEAFALASDVHRYHTDKGGEPYMWHPVAVAQRARDYYLAKSDGWQVDKVVAAALLHDTLEDLGGQNTWDRDRLRNRIYALDNEVYAAVNNLTKYANPPEPYDEYIERVARGWMSRVVKIADLSHNLDAFRIPSGKISERDFARWDKYHRALTRLMKEE